MPNTYTTPTWAGAQPSASPSGQPGASETPAPEIEKSGQPQNTCEQKGDPEPALTREEAEKRLRFILPGWVVDSMVQTWGDEPQDTFAEQARECFTRGVNHAIGDYTIMLIESGKHACCMIVDALGSFMDIVGDPCFSGPDHLRLNCILHGLPKMIANTLPHLQAALDEYEADGGQRLKSRDRYVLSKIATPMRLMKKAYSYAEDPRAFACTLLGEAKKIIAECRLLDMVNPWTVRLLEDLPPAPDIRLIAKHTSPA